METDFSNIICVADMNITGQLDQTLADLALPEVFVQRAKQMALADKQGLLRSVTKHEESRALIYRFYVPPAYEQGIMHRIAEATDLRRGGRGCIFTQRIRLRRGTPLVFDTGKLDQLCGKAGGTPSEEHALICCIVPRGMADPLASAVLELGICVPVVFFGVGVGLRDKLGLLRITIPVEKEIIWFLVPRPEADLVEKTLIPRARLDVPGHGFLYKCFVHAPVVNLRVRQGKRVHAATMDQVIAAMDEVRGSSDWRRLDTRVNSPEGETMTTHNRGLFFIGEEEDVEQFRLTAMENGARGATLNQLEMRSYSAAAGGGQARESRSRQLCDIIISPAIEDKLQDPITQRCFFDSGKSCVLKTFGVELSSAIRRGRNGKEEAPAPAAVS